MLAGEIPFNNQLFSFFFVCRSNYLLEVIVPNFSFNSEFRGVGTS